MQDPDTTVRSFLHDRVGALRDDLAAWARIPSVSADPAHERGVTRSARWLQAHLWETGFPEVVEWDTDGLQTVTLPWRRETGGAP